MESKCNSCNNKNIKCDVCNATSDIYNHHPCYQPKPKTNFDKITSSVDVLLDFLDKHTDFCTVDRCKECHDFNTMGCRECIRQWLQEEVKDE